MARYDLGLADDEFLSLTLVMLQVLVQRHIAERQYLELLNGIVASAVINYSMAAPDEPKRPLDFVFSGDVNSLRELAEPRKQTPEEMLAVLECQLGL